MPPSFDVIAIGDTTQDIFLGMNEAAVQCDLDGRNCRICFDYAEKIPVATKTDIPAVGNAANHAIGGARLGLKTALYTIVGDDSQGHKAIDVLKEEGVSTDYVTLDLEHGTNLSVVINYRGERTIFVYHEPRNYHLPELEISQWLYLTSASGDGVKILHKQVLTSIRQDHGVQLAFNPGTYQMKLGLEALRPLLAHTTILFLNREEAMRVLGLSSPDIKPLVQAFHTIGVKIMVITDGPKGAYASDGTTIYYQNIFRGPVVERTGCGDAFGSGFLAAIIKKKDIPEAMSWGSANSTSVLQYIGAREGLLREDSITKLIKENKDITVETYDTLSH